jgi:hypothetical protein
MLGINWLDAILVSGLAHLPFPGRLPETQDTLFVPTGAVPKSAWIQSIPRFLTDAPATKNHKITILRQSHVSWHLGSGRHSSALSLASMRSISILSDAGTLAGPLTKGPRTGMNTFQSMLKLARNDEKEEYSNDA